MDGWKIERKKGGSSHATSQPGYQNNKKVTSEYVNHYTTRNRRIKTTPYHKSPAPAVPSPRTSIHPNLRSLAHRHIQAPLSLGASKRFRSNVIVQTLSMQHHYPVFATIRTSSFVFSIIYGWMGVRENEGGGDDAWPRWSC